MHEIVSPPPRFVEFSALKVTLAPLGKLNARRTSVAPVTFFSSALPVGVVYLIEAARAVPPMK